MSVSLQPDPCIQITCCFDHNSGIVGVTSVKASEPPTFNIKMARIQGQAPAGFSSLELNLWYTGTYSEWMPMTSSPIVFA